MRERLFAWGCVAAGLAGSAVAYLCFVRTAGGQRVDGCLVPSRGAGLAARLLAAYDRNVVVVETIVLGLVVVVAACRGCARRGLLAAIIPPAVTVGVDLMKSLLIRPALIAQGTTHNSFPSGHVALAATTVVAVFLVLPRWPRLAAAAIGALAVAVVSAAVVAAGWHRFSDCLAAVLMSIAAGGAVVLASGTTPQTAERDGMGNRNDTHYQPCSI